MASELDSPPLGLEAAFGVRGESAPPLLRPTAAVCGAIVSPSAPANVALPLAWLTPEPHAAQNLAVSGTAETHCKQDMGAQILPLLAQARDSPHLPVQSLHVDRRGV